LEEEMAVVVGTEVSVTVPGTDDLSNEAHPITLAPGATPETVFEALNHQLGTNFTSEHFQVLTNKPDGSGQLTFAAGENITEQIQHGAQLTVAPRGELSLG
jgi:hypothetical protein